MIDNVGKERPLFCYSISKKGLLACFPNSILRSLLVETTTIGIKSTFHFQFFYLERCRFCKSPTGRTLLSSEVVVGADI